MIRKKVCMLGAYAVGKTSLVRRFVTDTFSDRYETTIGVKITKKELVVGDFEITLLLWDLHGDDEFQTVKDSYLLGAAGLLFVIDGTRPETVEKVKQLRARSSQLLGDIPCAILANKCDLQDAWELDTSIDPEFRDDVVFQTSAKTGAGVEEAFQDLCSRMTAPDE